MKQNAQTTTKRKPEWLLVLLTGILFLSLTACGVLSKEQDSFSQLFQNIASYDTLEEVPPYSGSPYVELNGNLPEFTEAEQTAQSYEHYSNLDSLGRCGAAQACIGTDLMPTQRRENISAIHPSGWVNHEYQIVDGGYLYNRCHLIAFQLTGENANEKNLITGTRYMNTEGMLPFENLVAQYIKETGNHVLYRVTPIFSGNDLVASGVQMEALSVEDDGDGVCFNIYAYNVQPDISINYATGENWMGEWTDHSQQSEKRTSYVLNENTRKFHRPDCPGVNDIKKANRKNYKGTRDALIAQGYEPCGRCKP